MVGKEVEDLSIADARRRSRDRRAHASPQGAVCLNLLHLRPARFQELN
jgi:hypothetical protein